MASHLPGRHHRYLTSTALGRPSRSARSVGPLTGSPCHIRARWIDARYRPPVFGPAPALDEADADCRISSEVLYEVQTFPDIEQLRALECPISSDLLVHVREVMKTEVLGDFKLVDLYRNKGNADPILIATALTAMRKGRRRSSARTGRS